MKIAPLWIGARGLEFDWKYVIESLDANVSLLKAFGFVLAVLLYRRKKSQQYVALSLLLEINFDSVWTPPKKLK